MRSLPLYADFGFTARDEIQDISHTLQLATPHPGLVFDKFIDTWRITPAGECSVQQPEARNASNKLKRGSKRVWLEETIARYNAAKRMIENGLTRALGCQQRLLKTVGGESIRRSTDWRFLSGLGNGHPFETGFIWHRTLGVPYLPGSAVKGLLRAWVKPVDEGGWSAVSVEEWTGDVKALFGDTDDLGAGRLMVLDAIPTAPPVLEVDVMNPHYGEYYQDPVHNPPADYLSPKPVFFLAVKGGQEFLFSLAPRPGAYDNDASGQQRKQDDLKKGIKMLTKALETIGAGGKTAVGYGHFKEMRA